MPLFFVLGIWGCSVAFLGVGDWSCHLAHLRPDVLRVCVQLKRLLRPFVVCVCKVDRTCHALLMIIAYSPQAPPTCQWCTEAELYIAYINPPSGTSYIFAELEARQPNRIASSLAYLYVYVCTYICVYVSISAEQ